MDKLVTTAQGRFWNPEAYARDAWIRTEAEKLPKGARVLDAGAGASKYRPYFQHCQYETQDFCQYQGELVKYVQAINHVCDITAIPLPDACLDAIVCTEVFEHVVDPAAVLGEFSRLLKSGGKLFLTAPMLSYMHMEPYHYFGGFTHYWYRHWLPVKGFKIELITPVGGPGQTWVAFGRALYSAWASAERKARPLPRWTSRCFRALARPFFYYLFPWLVPRFDAAMGNDLVCLGYMVSATRVR